MRDIILSFPCKLLFLLFSCFPLWLPQAYILALLDSERKSTGRQEVTSLAKKVCRDVHLLGRKEEEEGVI